MTVPRLLWVQEPWLYQIEIGRKTLEIRGRQTHYRGPLVLCSSKATRSGGYADEFPQRGPLGVTRCLVELVACKRFGSEPGMVRKAVPVNRIMGPQERARIVADWSHWAWEIRFICTVPHVAVQGRLGIVHPTPAELAAMPWLAAA